MTPVNLVIGLPMAAALGFAYGMGPCLISCAPFLAPVFLARDGGLKQSWRVVLPLSLGRLLVYISMGAFAGSLGYYAKGVATNPAIHLLLGCAVLMMGIALLLRKPISACAATASVKGGSTSLRRMDFSAPRPLLPGGLFLMGIAMALSPCAPLGIVLFSAAMSGEAINGALLGASFGAGAIFIPAVVFGVGLAYLGSRIREQLKAWQPRVERMSAWLLVLTGLGNLAHW